MQLPVRSYDGPVFLVNTSHDIDRARHELSQEHVVGFDTETRPAFRSGQSHLPSLVQVATAHTVFLFQLKQRDFSSVLTELLQNPTIAKVGIALDHDLKKLKLRFPFEEKHVVDIGAGLKRHGIEQTGVRNLTGMFLGFRITKGSRTSNWGRHELTPNQILYAATDAWVCRELYLCFQKRGFLDKQS